MEHYEFDITTTTTFKDLKRGLNDKFIFGDDLNLDQYEIYVLHADYILVNDDDKVDYIQRIKSPIFYLKVKLKIKLDIPHCRFNTVYLYTHDDHDDIF